MRAWLKFFRVVNVPTVPGDVLVGAAVIAWGAGHSEAATLAVRVVPLVAACGTSIALYLFGLADNDIVGAAKDGPERPIPAGEISLRAARLARRLCLFVAMIAGAAADLPPLWWCAAFLLATAIVIYNRTKAWFVMGACRGLDVLCGALAFVGRVPRGIVGSVLAGLFLFATLYVAAVTRYSEGEEGDPFRRRRVGLLIASIVYLQLVALLIFYLLSPTLVLRNLLLAGAVLLLLLRLAKWAFPNVSAS